jgi:hypothetical protein
VAENTLAHRQMLLRRSKGIRPKPNTNRGSQGEDSDHAPVPSTSHHTTPEPSLGGTHGDGGNPMEEDGKSHAAVLRGLGGMAPPAALNPNHGASKPPLYPGGVSRQGATTTTAAAVAGRAGAKAGGGGDGGGAETAATATVAVVVPVRQAVTGQLTEPLPLTSSVVYNLGSSKNVKVKARQLPHVKRVRGGGQWYMGLPCCLVTRDVSLGL